MSDRTAEVMGGELARTNTLSAAQWAWRGMLVMPLAAFAAIVGTLRPAGTGEITGWGLIFLVLALVWLVVLAPAAFVLRSHCFRAAWRGKPIDPESYLRGLTTVWVVLEVVAILSLASCVASHTLLPGILPGTLALILLALTGPSAKALALDEAG